MSAMPELPEVETVVRTLRPLLIGRRIERVIAADTKVLRTPRRRLAMLPARHVAAVERVGKYIRIIASSFSRDLKLAQRAQGSAPGGGNDDTLILTIHLGMAGRLLLVPADNPPEKHAYFRLLLSSEFRIPDSELRYVNPRWCMGGVWASRLGEQAGPTAALGCDPLSIAEADFLELLSRRRQIKALLLDQTMLAGVGNIYADESLFAAGIHPRAIAERLSPARRRKLLAALKDRLAEAIRKGGSTIRDYRDATGKAGFFQLALKVYGRSGEPCPVCGRPIQHNITAGRSTHFCANCQKR
jgi:formamidopyrimidine-DNA glycosylase